MEAEDIKSELVAKAFGKVMRQHRREQGLSQEKLAEISGLDRTYVSKLERGIHQPSLTALLKLAAAMRVSAAEMVETVRKKCFSE